MSKYVNRETISYIIFGVLTTVIGLGSFVLFDWRGFGTVTSNTVSTMLAVIFAFTTNKIFVFQSREWKCRILFSEFAKFCSARVVTFFAETVALVVLIDMVMLPSVPVKACTMMLVIIGNYILSKHFVFTSRNRG